MYKRKEYLQRSRIKKKKVTLDLVMEVNKASLYWYPNRFLRLLEKIAKYKTLPPFS